MASSNRHWPSMFKSKPCSNHHHHQWQHDHANPNSLISTACHRPPYTSVPGSEERSPEPKPRWNPKPEQIRILETIFNSGMVNPPRDEIRKIRAQLQEYGQVGDANVFYWFQNRKSRSKHKLRHLQNSKQPPTTTTAAASGPAPSTSSSSSDKSSQKSVEKALSISNSNILDMSSSPTASVNQTYFQAPAEFLPESFLFSGRFSFPEMSSGVHAPADQAVGNLLLGEIMMNHGYSKKAEDHEKMSYTTTTVATAPTTATTSIVPSTTVNVPSAISHFLVEVRTDRVWTGVGIGESQPQVGPAKSTVFINDVSFEVSVGPFNVREAFGDDAVLIHSNGHPVFTNEWGVTLQSLQHGGFYYLVRTLPPVTVSEAQLIWYIISFILPFSIQFLFGLRW